MVKGEDKTQQIISCHRVNGRYNIEFSNSPTEYPYAFANVRWLSNPSSLNPQDIRIFKNGQYFYDIETILQFEDYLRIFFKNGIIRSYYIPELQIERNCLEDEASKNCFEYFKRLADIVSIKTEDGKKLLTDQFAKIKFISNDTVLASYLNPSSFNPHKESVSNIVYFPFGCNLSQMDAVNIAFKNSLSIIEGPPGTGKTQTILNIIANAVIRGKSVAVVSGNNSATANVLEKMQKYNFDFIIASLGKVDNKKDFIIKQKPIYPDFESYKYEANNIEQTKQIIRRLEAEIKEMLAIQNKIADRKRQFSAIQLEKSYFDLYYRETYGKEIKVKGLRNIHSSHMMKLWLECQAFAEQQKKLSLWFKLKNYFLYGIRELALYRKPIDQLIPIFQNLYYLMKTDELASDIRGLEARLEEYNFNKKLSLLTNMSTGIFKDSLYKKYNGEKVRKVFTEDDLWKNSHEFNCEYPVILSTTYSIKSSLSSDHTYDYGIIDESSQVDLLTGMLALSCAKNAVIVGDLKQLPHVVSEQTKAAVKPVFDSFSLDTGYEYSHSLLSSVCCILPSVPRTLLKEHYRCHPKIIEFCNLKFYNSQLVIMTDDNGNTDVMKAYKTVAGNHARGHYNQRQIDEIKEIILPEIRKNFTNDEIGIISPYRKQTAELQKENMIGDLEISTVHKFQGREKDAIIITTVDNEISEFTDNPNMLNVAVSRAKKCLHLVVSDNEKNENTNIGDLVKYIQYNNFEVVQGEVYSVFDLLYKDYTNQRLAFLKKHKKISSFDSENLVYVLIRDILQHDNFCKYDVIMHQPLNMLIKNPEKLSDEECKYAMNPATHVDFLIYNKLDRLPTLVIEVDGYWFHKEGTVQAERDNLKNGILNKYSIPFERLSTVGSMEREKIVAKLNEMI